MRRQRLAIEARGIDVECAGRTHRTHHRQYPRFPFAVKHRLILLRLDLAETIYAAHVVHAIHDGAPAVLGTRAPIMESPVTSSASCCSFQRPLPLGRIS